ncbi:DMT family transporter [Natronorubrum halophilum]|uniref:DMT family transporter n=1 Tax=Natronorubrum halophilum TaxID=1702106 RepID=UPI0010C223E7|nr:EamA family transporter [Natronorubrum halophilum]
MDEETVGIAYVLASAAGFGTLGVFGIVANDVGLSIPTVLAFRFGFASITLWLLLAVRGRARLLTGRTLGWAIVLGVAGYGSMSGFYFWGLEYLTAGLVAIVLYTYPAMIITVTAVTNPRRVDRRLLAALCLSLGGVALIVGADPSGVDPRGVLLVLVAAVSYAGYMMGSEHVLESVDSQLLSAHVLPAAGISFLGIGLAMGTFAVPSATETTAWGVLAALALLSTAAPILLLYAGLRRIGSSKAGIASTIEPAVAVVFGAVALGEPVTATTVVGGGLIVAGVLAIRR